MKAAYGFCLAAGWAVAASAAPPTPAESPAVTTAPTAAPAPSTPPATVAGISVAQSATLTTPRAVRGKVTDHVELDQTTITGNRELPNVMVIVPWKESGPGEPGKPGTSLLDEALAPLDREEFRRELQYDQALRGKAPPVLIKPAPLSPTTSP